MKPDTNYAKSGDVYIAYQVQVMGDNIGGIAVHIASRVQSESAPGEVLVSSTTKDLIAGSGISFQPRGERDLKGVPGTWHLYAVVNH